MIALGALCKATQHCNFQQEHVNFHKKKCTPHCQRIGRWSRGNLQTCPGKFPEFHAAVGTGTALVEAILIVTEDDQICGD